MRNKRKQGFSMIELIIVVAIIGIFTGLSAIGMSYVRAGNVKRGAVTVNSNLTKLRYDALRASSSERPYMYLYKIGDSVYMQCSDKAESSVSFTASAGMKISNGNCRVTYNGGNEIPSASSRGIKIGYKKGSGGFLNEGIFSSKQDVADITFKTSSGDGTTYIVQIVRETGKHYIEIK